MSPLKKAGKIASTALLSLGLVSFSQTSQAVDPITGAVLLGGAVALAVNNHHHSHYATYPSYRRVVTKRVVTSYPTVRKVVTSYPVAHRVVRTTSPVYLASSSYGYVSPVRYVVKTRPMVKGHACGYDGICIGH